MAKVTEPIASSLHGLMPTGSAPAIHTLDLAKHFGSTIALSRLSMSVAQGEVFGFLGPNGAGKTTAVKLLVGLSAPSGGEGWVLVRRWATFPCVSASDISPSCSDCQDWLSAREVLALHTKLAGIPRDRRQSQVDHALEIAGLTTRGEDRVGTYSKGMQQRLGLGVALLGAPDIVFLDEPTSALDPVGRHDVREIIRDLRIRGTTVFLNSHLLSEVEQVCDRVAIVDKGHIIAMGTLDDLRGYAKAVRVRATNVNSSALGAISDLGEVHVEEGGIVVRGVDDGAVPALVQRLVGAGARIYSVQPAGSLEESFLSLLEAQDHATTDNR